MTLDRNVDFRYAAGFPPVSKALRDGTRMVRCISLPDMEGEAGEYLDAGIRVLAVYTGESDNAGHYVQRNASAIQIGNEPEFAMRGGASWPTGSVDDMVNVWGYVANVLVPEVHPQGIPLVGPGIWTHDYAKWAMVADYLPGLSAAAVHVYPETTGESVRETTSLLAKFADVRGDLPLICTEWKARQPNTLAYARAIDAHCAARLWYGPGTPGFELEGTQEYGVLAMA